MANDPYSELGLKKGASDAEIQKAFRKLAKELHPDTNRDNKVAEERFKRVTAAYDFLKDSARSLMPARSMPMGARFSAASAAVVARVVRPLAPVADAARSSRAWTWMIS